MRLSCNRVYKRPLKVRQAGLVALVIVVLGPELQFKLLSLMIM